MRHGSSEPEGSNSPDVLISTTPRHAAATAARDLVLPPVPGPAAGAARSGFSCGQPDLDRFIAHYAGQNQFKLHLAVTSVS